ncbi:DUF445 family protein [Aquibacillus halophilus]|uniref:DUF445 family protein n=1 Tax=Aquibacillus halophilus TaxID=930132 RepID=A0A6A8DEU7_9BACI|nr:DUF445 family protein [Aquibacillus halophilus]MRH44114.1 DUF445 family protein [Aquibacillus halophilus]
MTALFIIIMMIIIGAAIGGVTNSLAIKMLFRPFEAKYIGKWKLPLTPGLIPKRRDELARQLGKTVVDHLLTPEGIKKKLRQSEFNQQVTIWAQSEVNRVLDQNLSTKVMLAKIGIYLNEQQLKSKIADLTEKQYEKFMDSKRPLLLREVISEEWLNKTDEGKKWLTDYVQQQLTSYVTSDTARSKIGQVVDDYLDGKGFFVNMISSFLGNEGLADRIQPILVQYLQSRDAREWINEILSNELDDILDLPVEKIEAQFDSVLNGAVLGKVVSESVPVEKWLNKSVTEWIEPFKAQLLSHIVPTIVTKLSETLVDRIDLLMKKFRLEEIVEKEVESFPIERVEQLVLNISSKEFKLITYLGALLGGLIGLVQGIIVLLVS